MNTKELPSQAELRELFWYKDGALVWKPRPPITQYDRRHNKHVAGMVAGCTDGRGYIVVRFGGITYKAHRLIYQHHYGECPPIIDHINRDPSDNRIENLRPATNSESQANRRSLNPSGFKCVRERGGRFVAEIKLRGKLKHLGIFDTPEEASVAYMNAARQQWGEFATGAMK